MDIDEPVRSQISALSVIPAKRNYIRKEGKSITLAEQKGCLVWSREVTPWRDWIRQQNGLRYC